jgi:hypothetical protein
MRLKDFREITAHLSGDTNIRISDVDELEISNVAEVSVKIEHPFGIDDMRYGSFETVIIKG